MITARFHHSATLSTQKIWSHWQILSSQQMHSRNKLQLLVCSYLWDFSGGPADTLRCMRYAKYMLKVSSGSVLPDKLPPISRAAFYHCLRVHLQAVCCIMLNTLTLNPTDWGWKYEDGKMCSQLLVTFSRLYTATVSHR